MKVVVIKDEDAKALIDTLQLQKFRQDFFATENMTKEQMYTEIHRAFHYRVVEWLQKHGASVT